jgi:hypothetical protein
MKKKGEIQRKAIRKTLRISARVPEALFEQIRQYAADRYTTISQLIIDTLLEKIEKKQGEKPSDKKDLPAS